MWFQNWILLLFRSINQPFFFYINSVQIKGLVLYLNKYTNSYVSSAAYRSWLQIPSEQRLEQEVEQQKDADRPDRQWRERCVRLHSCCAPHCTVQRQVCNFYVFKHLPICYSLNTKHLPGWCHFTKHLWLGLFMTSVLLWNIWLSL